MTKGLLTAILMICACFSAAAQDINSSDQHLNIKDSLPKTDSIPIPLRSVAKLKSYIVPAAFVSYGLVSLTGERMIRKLDYSTSAELLEDHPGFAVKADNYLRFVPAVAVYGLDLFGVKAKNKVIDRSIMLFSSLGIATVGVSALKGLTQRERPNGSNTHSFPSGHTAVAFVAAEFLHQEYKDQSVWYSIGGYAVATGTGVLRMYNNAHWLSDVVAGAGFGILSTKLTYLVYPYLKRKVLKGKFSNLMVCPGYANGNMNFNLVKKL